jgi:integrase
MKKVSAKPKRTKGDGTLYQRGRIWWISYKHPDGTRRSESTHTDRRVVAERLLRKRIGARENNLAVIAGAEQLTFHKAAQAVIDNFAANNRESQGVVERRINKHLREYFGNRRMLGITMADVTAYVAKRQKDVINVRQAHMVTLEDGTRQQVPAVTKPTSNATINRELQVLKRMFSLAIKGGLIATKPCIEMLRESEPRRGFFEREQYESVVAHLPAEIGAVITFAYLTGWRVADEILPLEWRQVDFDAGEVRLDPGTTKNGHGRVFPFDEGDDLHTVLSAQHAEHERLKKAGQISPLVFFRLVDHRGKPEPKQITSFTKVWRNACRAAGCPGRIPHDLRRTAVRNLVRTGVSESTAMKLTGHITASVFKRYEIVSDSDLRDAAKKLQAGRKLVNGH